MTRIKKVVRNKHEGKIILGNGIVEGIVNIAVAEIPFVELFSTGINGRYNKNTIKVTFDKEGVHVDVVVKIHYSQSVSNMAFKIQEVVRHNVEAMTDYHIASVNVIVRGVTFEDIKQIEVKPTTENKEISAEKQENAQDNLQDSTQENQINDKNK